MTAQLSFFCGHRYAGMTCILLPHEYGCHFNGVTHWRVGAKFNLRRGKR
jgi:hypothetical protein